MQRTVLVIEDDDDVRYGIVTVLSEQGYAVVEAPDGAEGLTRARDHRPDLILADYRMPNADGLDLLEAVRKDEHLAQTPFVFITVDPTLEMRRIAARTGIDGFLTKPFSMDELIRTVHDMLHTPQN